MHQVSLSQDVKLKYLDNQATIKHILGLKFFISRHCRCVNSFIPDSLHGKEYLAEEFELVISISTDPPARPVRDQATSAIFIGAPPINNLLPFPSPSFQPTLLPTPSRFSVGSVQQVSFLLRRLLAIKNLDVRLLQIASKLSSTQGTLLSSWQANPPYTPPSILYKSSSYRQVSCTSTLPSSCVFQNFFCLLSSTCHFPLNFS